MTYINFPAGLDLGTLRNFATSPKPSHEQILPDEKVPVISYLRVSKCPATRNGHEEGLPVPAQSEAAQRKADQVGTVIDAEFIEPGEPGQTTRRNAF